jgi:cellulose synthase/poly-beta-1,6-N-acetylglucosamine synthase-like glycosyltransferase
MPKVEKSKIFQEKVNYFFLILTFIGEHFLRGFFFVAIILGITRLLALLVMALIKQHKIRKHPVNLSSDYMPKVTVLVPGYNEELNAVRTVENLLKSDYSNIEILFIDDGSKDNTYNKVAKAFENNPKVKVMTKPNGGKASALNFGIERADCDILVCIDADTVLLPDAISKMIPYFTDEDVAAVAGNVRVGNTLNMLTNWQKIEYTTSQNFDRVAFDVVNAILVVPGAIGAFRKSSIDEIGGFTTDTLAEDCDLTVRLLRAGYKIHTCNDAVSMTEAPESMKMFMKQRFRWTFGMMQCLWKHRDLIFNTRLPNMGWILLPNLLIFGFILPLFSPIVDIMFLDGLVSEHGEIYLAFYFMYFVIDLFLAMLAYRYDNQKFRLKHVWLLFVQRFVYRWILFVVLIKAYLRAIKGELTSWGVLKRTGNMDM